MNKEYFFHYQMTTLFLCMFGVSEAIASRNGSFEKQIEEIVVTAQKREQHLQDIPVSINAFGAARLENSSIGSIEDIEFLAAGLNIGNDRGQIFLSMRGVSSKQPSPGAESGAAVHSDGVYLASRWDQGSAFFDVERIEVLRGPQGTLYGRNATGGAINIITKEPTNTFEYGGKLTRGDYNLISTEAYLSGPLAGDSLTGRMAVTKTSHDGYTKNIFNGDAYDDADNFGIRTKIRYQPTDTFRLDVTLDHSEDKGVNTLVAERVSPDISIPGEDSNHILPAGRRVNNNADTFQEVEVSGALVRAKWDFNQAVMTSLTSYRKTDFDSAFDVDWTSADNSLFKTWIIESDQISQEFNLASVSNGGIDWLIGANYFSENKTTFLDIALTTLSTSLLLATPQLDTESYALFGEASYPMGEKLHLTVGARYSYEKKYMDEYQEIFGFRGVDGLEDNWESFTPKASLTYSVNEDVMTYITIAEGFKSGGFNGGELQGEAFAPEKVLSYELGLKGRFFDNSIQTNIAAFYMDYKDLQVRLLRDFPDPIPDQRLITNAAKSTIQGIEFDFRAQATEHLSLEGNVSYLDAVYDEYMAVDPMRGNQAFDASGNQMIDSPEWSANYGVEYSTPIANWGTIILRGEYLYKGKTYYNEFNELYDYIAQDSFSIVNARISFEAAEADWRIAAFVNNVNNVEAATAVAGDALVRRSSLIAPRIYGATIAFDF